MPEILGVLSILIGCIGEAYYLRSIFRGHTKPHMYTWLIWSILCTIGSLAQFTEDQGPGVWALAVTSIFSWLNTGLCFKYGEKEITKSDKIALAFSLLAIVPWALTDDPLWSVIMISLIDVVGFYPTIRKTWKKPYEENLLAYYFANAKLLLSVIALERFSIVTALYPIVIVVTNCAFLVMAHWKRQGNHRNF
ncbi:MAG: hypothetical protein DI586_09920 [Micavibrio aeruginosavorus]|uniref:Uncharacterized protein n=1 Tax=Micavibrio aeruginosavorus TaxID=349221 RepID=A0A2W5H8S3_9BACT|nr:MAG: hypothetical protein DI586_09920 [Micavibrio aeruginosavorus]